MQPAELLALARRAGLTLAVAESLTAGMLCSRLADVPGASIVLRGGVIPYATDLKELLLGVDGDLLARNGPVDPQVAVGMATGVRQRLRADVGIATTGVAGPEPQGDVPPGVVFVAVAWPGGQQARRLELTGDRGAIREQTCAAALDLVGQLLAPLREHPGPTAG